MPIITKYYDLGGRKRLNQIVMAGSHDAAITSGKPNAKTQALDILGQAEAGVRLFDLRITGQIVGSSGEGSRRWNPFRKDNQPKEVALKAYHGKPSNKTVKGMISSDKYKSEKVADVRAVKKLTYGTWGISLDEILNQAGKFVTDNFNEFLLLKFDKCDNWSQIAEMCIKKLSTNLYAGGGNLNITTLDELKGKVVVLFTPTGYKPEFKGILPIKNLYTSGEAYKNDFHGLQYWGKGGTNPWTWDGENSENSIRENIEKQKKIFRAPSSHARNPNIMGMMYWTTTGIGSSIEKRTKNMWTSQYSKKMLHLWEGMVTNVEQRIPLQGGFTALANPGKYMKQFMPNFIMIDFADATKCITIYDLNKLLSTKFYDLYTFKE